MEKHIGQRIAEKRKELGWSQEELAKKVGYTSRSTINKIELGKSDVSATKVRQFADVMQCSISYLMHWDEMEMKNDALADIIIRMRTDDAFFEFVLLASMLGTDDFTKASAVLNTLFK